MEHLLFEIDEERQRIERFSAELSDVLERDWTTLARHTNCPPHVPPTTEWLRFPHPRERDQVWIPVQTNLDMYPIVRGWNMLNAWDRGDLRKASPCLEDDGLEPAAVGRCVASMIQSWLYFGLLEAISGKWLDVSYLVRNSEEGTPLLYSRNLPFVLYAWRQKLETLSPEERQADLDRAYDNLMVVGGCIQQLLLWSDLNTARGQWTEMNYPGYNQLIYMITPSIIRLTDVIGTTRDRLIAEADVRIIAFCGMPGSQQSRNSRLKERGWCPFLLEYCRNDMNESVLDWLDATQKNSTSGGHITCTTKACSRNNVDPEAYKMQHLTPGCNCGVMKPNLQDVLNAIDDEKIPTMRLREMGSTLELVVSRCAPDTVSEYVASSHVWVDGLGSNTETGIYECQARHLMALAQRACPGSSWWIDSLCVPYIEPYRGKSIRHLRNVYTNARKVVVIDKTMNQCRSDAKAEEVLWAIISSAWMQRMWTYQESFLAADIVAEFKDVLQSLEPVDLPRSNLQATVQVVWVSLISLIGNLRPDRSHQLDRKTNMGEVLAGLNWRTTSRTSDETLAVCGLLYLDASNLTQTIGVDDSRMRTLLLMVRHMPNDMLFFEGPRMQEPPFRWAPSTLMARSETMVDSINDHQHAECTSEGLQGTQCFLELSETQIGVDDTTYLALESAEQDLYSFGWDSASHNRPGSFNAVIVRPFENDQYLVPSLNQVMIAVAVLFDGEQTTEGCCKAAFTGQLTITKLDKHELQEVRPYVDARWHVERVCIT